MQETSHKKKTVLSPPEAMKKAQKYCAYQERSQQEVRDKLYRWGLHKNEVENILAGLISSGFVNEERFASAFAGGRFRVKKWGRVKIERALQQKNITDYCIRKALKGIEEKDYKKTLHKLAEEKLKKVKETNPLKKKYKVASYLLSKGFESEMVWLILNDLEK